MAIEKTAISVAMNGVDFENEIREKNETDESYCWLNDKECCNYKYYQQRLQELRSALKKAADYENGNDKGDDIDDNECDISSSSPVHNEVINEEEEEQEERNDRKRKQRKSRWGEASAGQPDAVSPSSSSVSTSVPVPQDIGLIQYALQVYGSTDLTSDQWKQLEDQRKMKVLFQMMQAKQKEMQRMDAAGKVKYEYDSDEETDGGTWEHKRRKQEMDKTIEWAKKLTESSRGRHHLGDYLPQDELEKFLQKWEAIKDGKTSKMFESDYHNFKLQSDNVGFKMLKKLGWQEGTGLGNNPDSIIEPINKNASGIANAGLGQVRPDELKHGDDEYEAYRKRMMLAYRFRPNPLNNPRRAYY